MNMPKWNRYILMIAAHALENPEFEIKGGKVVLTDKTFQNIANALVFANQKIAELDNMQLPEEPDMSDIPNLWPDFSDCFEQEQTP